MACRIQSLKPPCAYNVEGIRRIFLLDYEDFIAFGFGGLYDSCLVTALLRSGDFVEVETPNSAKYSSTGTYVHTLETFVGALNAETLATLHLATKRRYLVVFQTNAGQYFTFGYDQGATVTYAGQTAEATGCLITVTAATAYPLFEITEEAFNQAPEYKIYDIPYVTQYE